jgi:hypothetical protein
MSKKAKGFETVAEALRSVERSTVRRRRARERHAAEVAARVPGEGYEPCIVSFIDVLGFRNLLETRHAHDIRDVLLQLRAFTAPVEELPTRRMKDARLLSRAFADSVSDAVVRVRSSTPSSTTAPSSTNCSICFMRRLSALDGAW